MQHAGMTIASLNVIRRQRDPELRRAVQLASAGKAGEVIEALTQQDRITQIAPAVDRYRAIAEDYLRSYQAEQRTVVEVPPTRSGANSTGPSGSCRLSAARLDAMGSSSRS